MFFLGHKRHALRAGREAADSKQQRRWQQQQQQQQMKVRPRLERLNAAKDIDYEVPSGPSSPSASPDVSTVVHTPRMLDLSLSSSHYSKQSSFRLCGSVDGEVDALCQILGLSGPEDFGIPMSAWEEHKARLSSVLARSRHLQPDGSPPENHTFASKESTFLSNSAALDASLTPVDTFLSKRIAATDRESRFSDTSGREITVAVGAEAGKSQKSFLGSGGGRNGGIQGVRPPVLAPPAPLAILPPPSCRPTSIAIKLPQSMSSLTTDWSILPYDVANSITPEVVGDDFCTRGQRLVNMENDEGGLDRDAHGIEFMLGESSEGFMGMSSYSTVNDDETSSSSTETMINISPNGRFKTRITSWMKGICLGSGSYGTVYEAISDEGVFFAVKEVSLVDQGLNAQHSITQLEQEIALLSQFEHENIVQYFGTDKEDSKLFIFLELVTKGSLASLYQKYSLQESQASAYTRQILNGLDYLHELNVVHRDIKCANILVHANGSVKLADFGLAKEMTNFNMLKSCKGSVYWMAPEVLNPNRGYGLSADIWSLGCTVLEMLTRQVPYGNLEWAQAAYKISHGEPPTIPKNLSKAAQDFIGQCLKLNPNARPTASQLLDHPFVRRSLRASPGSHSCHGNI